MKVSDRRNVYFTRYSWNVVSSIKPFNKVNFGKLAKVNPGTIWRRQGFTLIPWNLLSNLCSRTQRHLEDQYHQRLEKRDMGVEISTSPLQRWMVVHVKLYYSKVATTVLQTWQQLFEPERTNVALIQESRAPGRRIAGLP